MLKRCPYCKRVIFGSKLNCPYCDSKLGIHRHSGPRFTLIYFALSMILGVPIGGAIGLSINTFVLFHGVGYVPEVAGGILGTFLFYTYFILHDEKK